MIIIRWINRFFVCVQSDLILDCVILCDFVDILIFLRFNVIYFIYQLGHIIKMQDSDWCVMYIMQAVCFCWLCCLMHFLTNTWSVIYYKCYTCVKKKRSFSVWIYDLLLIICSVYFLFYSEKTCFNWKPIKLLWWLCMHIPNYLCKRQAKDVYIILAQCSIKDSNL